MFIEPYLIQLNNDEITISHHLNMGLIRIDLTGLTGQSITMNSRETKRLIDVLQKKLDLLR